MRVFVRNLEKGKHVIKKCYEHHRLFSPLILQNALTSLRSVLSGNSLVIKNSMSEVDSVEQWGGYLIIKYNFESAQLQILNSNFSSFAFI